MEERFIGDVKIEGETYTIYEVTEDGSNHFDVYNSNGECINLGCPFDEVPSTTVIKDFLEYNK